MKLFYFTDKNKPLNYYGSNEQIVIPNKYKGKEVRAFWVSTVYNIDMPILDDEFIYKNKLDEIINTAIKFNINTIFFQVRPTNDAFYKSELNPYSRFLTGEEGLKPKFDVLEYLINKAKDNNIKIHAWANPYRVSMPLKDITKDEYLNTLSSNNYARINPTNVITDTNNQLILNPTKEDVKQFIVDSMIEIINNYEVAGIHWDDYFYPYADISESDSDIPDFNNREDKSMSLEEFRRFHVNDVIERTYNEIKKINKKIEFGLSPFGIWLTKESDERGANISPNVSESFKKQYADSYTWVKKGYIDYIIPQLYWEFGHSLAPFADLTKWWSNLVKDTKVKLYIGHASYRLGNEGEFSNPLEVVNQVMYANNYNEVSGNVFFTYKNFLNIEVPPKGMENIRKLLNNEEI